MSEHPSSFEMMRLLSGELDAGASERIRVHSASCTPCQASFRELEAIQANGATEAPPLVRLVPQRRWAKIAGALALAASIAAVMLLLPPDSLVRKKGGAEIRMYCQQPGQSVAELCRSGSKLPPGTSIAFRAQLKDAEWMMVYGYDGTWTRHFPQNSEQATLLGVDREDLLNGSLMLDDRKSPESFIIFRSTKPFDSQTIAKSISRNGTIVHLSEDLTMVRFDLEKRMSQSENGIR